MFNVQFEKLSGVSASGVARKGFHITFPNGVTVSAQFSPFNYCSARGPEFNTEAGAELPVPDCEFAAFNEAGDWKTAEVFAIAGLEAPGDDVAAYVTPLQFITLCNAAMTLKGGK